MQIDEFRASSLERQFEIFLLDLKCRHPHDLEFTEIIAERGNEAVPFLEERLRESKSERQKASIIGIFMFMSIMHTAGFRQHPDLLIYLENEIVSMKNPSFKNVAERALQEIKEKNELSN